MPSNHWGISSQMAENFHLLNYGYGSLLIIFGPSNFLSFFLFLQLHFFYDTNNFLWVFLFLMEGNNLLFCINESDARLSAQALMLFFQFCGNILPAFIYQGDSWRLGAQFVTPETEPDIVASLTWCYNKAGEPQP